MIYLKTEEEIDLLRAANRLVSATLTEIAKIVKPGVSVKALDTLAEQYIRDHGAVPTFKGFPADIPGAEPFPGSICASINECVVHGLPDERVLRDGDIISVDCGTYLNGFCGDSAYTFCVGEVSDEVKQLLRVTKESLYLGIGAALPGRALATSAQPYKTIANDKATVWFVSSPVTASVARCTKILRYPTTEAADRASKSRTAFASRSNR